MIISILSKHNNLIQIFFNLIRSFLFKGLKINDKMGQII
jgi:hypothetical protein